MDQNAAKKAAAILRRAKDEALKILKQSGGEAFAITVESGINQLINRLNYASGTGNENDKPKKFKPVTNFMGEDITLPVSIKEEDITPAEAEKIAFRNKVDKLYKQFTTIPPEGILKDYTLPEDVLVIRGVAKRAGINDYADRQMDEAFMKDIAEGIESKAAEDAKQKEIDEALKKNGGKK